MKKDHRLFDYPYKFIALRVHELEASEIKDLEFSLTDSDHLPIDDIEMFWQWKSDSSFKVIIDLKVSRKKTELVAEVSCSFCESNVKKWNKVLIARRFEFCITSNVFIVFLLYLCLELDEFPEG